MKIKNKIAVFLTALLVSFSSSAIAFEGFSIGASYSSLDFSTSVSETKGVTHNPSETTTTKKSGDGDVGSIFAEYTFSQGSTIGIESISGSTEIGKGSRTESSATITASAEVSDPLTFYVEPTWMANDKFGIYLKGGATRVTLTPKEVADSGNHVNSTYSAQDVWGIMTGIGAKAYYNNFFVKAEYVETEYEKYSFTSTTGNKNTVTANVDTEEARVSIGYNF